MEEEKSLGKLEKKIRVWNKEELKWRKENYK